MYTIEQFYKNICSLYANRTCWISDLASNLKISYADAEFLTSSLGFYRGKLINGTITPCETFVLDSTVQIIYNKYCKAQTL